jgi:uncharacterized protein (TIGR02265 family)
MDSRDLFLRRIAIAGPRDQILGAFIDGTVVSLGEEFSAAVVEEVRKAQQHPKGWALFSKYPLMEWLQLMEVAASTAVLAERISYSEALERMGKGSVRHVLRTSTGRIFSTLVGKDPHRVMSTSTISARAFATWGERVYEKLGPKSGRMRLKREFMGPAWVRGFYVEVLQSHSQLAPTITLEDCEEPGMDFALRFDW